MDRLEALIDQSIDSWRINQRLNIYFLSNISDDSLALKSAKSKSVGGHFSHIHTVRLMWIKAAAPELMEGLSKLDDSADRDTLKLSLGASSEGISILLASAFRLGKVKNFKPHPAAFLGYLLSHEAFHRSQAELVLRQNGAPLDDKVGYGLWEWGTR